MNHQLVISLERVGVGKGVEVGERKRERERLRERNKQPEPLHHHSIPTSCRLLTGSQHAAFCTLPPHRVVTRSYTAHTHS